MRIESSVTSVSWIPSEAVTGAVLKGTFETGFTHYDDPPPDVIDDLEELRAAGRVPLRQPPRGLGRDRGRPDRRRRLLRRRAHGRDDGAPRQAPGHVRARPAPRHPPRPRDLRRPRSRFVQTTGGRTGLPAPRRVKHPPFVQFKAPTVWTTLALTIRADGTSSFEVLGASKFPRHWVYDADGKLAAKVGLADFKDWYRDAFGKHTPWGDRDSKALVTAVETALERQLSSTIMRGGRQARDPHGQEGQAPRASRATPGNDLFLLLDGVLVGARSTASRSPSSGPGAILGERAVLEGGHPHRDPAGGDRRAGRGGAAPTRSTAPRCSQLARDTAGVERDDVGSVAAVRIATWNVNSLKARQDRASRSGSPTRTPDVLCLQETKLADDAFPRPERSPALGYDSVHHGHSQWNGVAILSRVGIERRHHRLRRRPSSTPTRATPALLAATCGGVRVVQRLRAERSRGRHRVLRAQARVARRAARLARRRRRRPTDDARRARRLQRRARRPRRVVAQGVRGRDPRHRARARRRRAACDDWGMVDAFRAPLRRRPALHLLGLPPGRLPPAPRHAHRPRARHASRSPNASRWAVVDRNARKGKQPSDHAPLFVDFA